MTSKKKTPESTGPGMWDVEAAPVTESVTPEPEVYAQPVKLDKPDFGYDLEGLMTDFPTATELQKFVYDQTGVVLNLKGRANKVKYQVAMDTLNGTLPATEFLGTENPYVDRNELVPQDPLRELPPRDPEIDAAGAEVTRFATKLFPHPHPEWKAQDQKCHVIFRKYQTGMITYEILGPIAKKAFGSKINKFGVVQPEKIGWIDPRTGEQIVQREDGTLTPVGRRLRAMMQTFKFNDSNQWIKYVDREFISLDRQAAENPWDLE